MNWQQILKYAAYAAYLALEYYFGKQAKAGKIEAGSIPEFIGMKAISGVKKLHAKVLLSKSK